MSEPIELSLFRPEFLADPVPFYRRLREEAPVYWSNELGAWLISRHADVKMLWNDPRATPDQKAWSGDAHLRERASAAPNVMWALDETLLLCHGAKHARLRRFAHEPFLPGGCGRIARVTERVVREVLDGFSGRGEIDLLADYSVPIRIRVMSRLLGVEPTPEEERFLVAGTNAALGFLEPSTDGETIARNDAALKEFRAIVARIVAQSLREGAGDSMVADLRAPDREGDRLSENEVIALVFSFLLAGTEANGSLITMGILTLLEHRQQLATLRREPGRFADALKEILRYRSFTKFLPRYIVRDLDLHGKTLRPGQIALLLFQSAFRDPEAFEAPDVFDVTRKQTNSLAFGAGPHRCVGERMAEIEGAVALREFFTRYPGARRRDAKEDWAKHHMLVAVPRTIPVIPLMLA
ncbi:MAG TPA: cytochrome P450 [Polyangiaceae bacterium]|nr:cytochrome P450 [Polyangiaceae bacterium]